MSWWILWKKLVKNIFFHLFLNRGHNSLIYGESIPVGMSKLHSMSTRTFWWKFFFSKLLFFSHFRKMYEFFPDFRVIFWQGCQCCKRAVLRSILRINFVLKKSFIHPIEMLSGILFRHAELFFARVSKLPSTCPRVRSEEIFSKKNFSNSCGFWAKFFWLFADDLCWNVKTAFYMSRGTVQGFFFSDFQVKFSAVCCLSKKVLAGYSKLHFMCPDGSFEKNC